VDHNFSFSSKKERGIGRRRRVGAPLVFIFFRKRDKEEAYIQIVAFKINKYIYIDGDK